MSALGIKVLRGDKVCVDCSDNLHKFLYFKKKITEIHIKKKLPKKSKSDLATQSSVRNKVSNGFRGQEGVGGQAVKDSVEGQKHYSEVETLLVEMTNSTGDQKEDKSYNQKQNSLSADTKAALSSTVPPKKFATPPTANVKTKVSSSSTSKATPTMFSMVFSGDPKNYCVVQHPPGTVLLTNNHVLKQPPPIGSVPLTNNHVLKQPPPIGSVPLTNNHVLKQPPPIRSIPLTNHHVLKQPPPIGSVPLTNNHVLKQPPPKESVPLTNHHVLKQPPPIGSVPLTNNHVLKQPPPKESVPLTNNHVLKQPPPIGSVPLTNNQVLNQTLPIESVPLTNNEIIIQKGGAIMLATQGGGSALPAPISSSTSKMQKTTSYVPIQSKKPPSPQTTQSVTTQVQAKSTTGTLPAPQEDSVGEPSTTKSVNSTPIPVSPKLSNLEESKEKDVVAFKNADLSQAAPLPAPVPSAFIRALPKSEETSPPNIQIITNPTSSSQSKTTTPLAVPSMAGNLAEQGLMPLRVTDISNYSPQGHSAAAKQQTMAPPRVTTEQENPSSRGDSSFIKIGKMTYQLVVKNNQQLLVPGLPQLPYKQRSSTKKKRNLHWLPTDNNFDCRKRKFTFEHPEKV